MWEVFHPVLSVCIYTSFDIFLTDKKRDVAEILFFRRRLRIPLTEYIKKIGTTNKLIVTIRKIVLKFLSQIMGKEGLENVTLTRHIESKRS